MKIDIALSGCQMIKRMAEDYRVQFGCWFREKKNLTRSVPVFVCVFYMAVADKSGVRLRVDVKAVLHYADLEDLHLYA